MINYHVKIYAIRHNVTNRVYIGSSQNVDSRIKQHLVDLRAHKHVVEDMQEDFDKYGEDYTFTILEDIYRHCDRYKEYEWQKKYQSYIRGVGYNYKDRVWNRPKGKYTLTLNGKTMSIGDWAIFLGVPYKVLYRRAVTMGWDDEKALTTPVGYFDKGDLSFATILDDNKAQERDYDAVLLRMIRNHPNPEEALITAVNIITDFIARNKESVDE